MTGLGNAEQISLVPVKKYWTELTCTVLWLSGCTLILLLVLNDVKDIVYYFDLFCRDWLGIIYFPKRRYMVWSLSCFPDNPKTSISQCGHLMGKKNLNLSCSLTPSSRRHKWDCKNSELSDDFNHLFNVLLYRQSRSFKRKMRSSLEVSNQCGPRPTLITSDPWELLKQMIFAFKGRG